MRLQWAIVDTMRAEAAFAKKEALESIRLLKETIKDRADGDRVLQMVLQAILER